MDVVLIVLIATVAAFIVGYELHQIGKILQQLVAATEMLATLLTATDPHLSPGGDGILENGVQRPNDEPPEELVELCQLFHLEGPRLLREAVAEHHAGVHWKHIVARYRSYLAEQGWGVTQ